MAGAISSVDPNIARGFENYLEASEPSPAGDEPAEEVSAPPDPETALRERMNEQLDEEGPGSEETPEEGAPNEPATEEIEAAGEEPEEGEEVIDTLHDLAEMWEVEEDELLEHLQVPGLNEGDASVSLKSVLDQYRGGPGQSEAATAVIEQERTALREVNQKAVTDLEQVTAQLIQKIQRHTEPEGGWDALRVSDPSRYIQARESQEADRRDAEGALNALDENKRRFDEEQTARHEDYVKEQASRIYSLRPEWRDQKAGQAAFEDINGYLKNTGFPEEQIQALEDALSIVTVWKAAQYDKAQAAKPALRKRLRKLPTKHVRASARDEVAPQREQMKARNAQLDKFEKSGRIEDALGFFEEHVD